MPPKTKGLHHFTAISGDPIENAKFYVNTLGMRMVKKTVNHDAPTVYHLYYGDAEGTPGSNITFFPNMTPKQGEPGAGMFTELGLRIPENTQEYWKQRLIQKEIENKTEEWRGKQTILTQDPHGMKVRLVPGKAEEYETWEESPVPGNKQIKGMHHVTASVQQTDYIKKFLQFIGLEEKSQNYYQAEDNSKVEVKKQEKEGKRGK